MATMWAKITKIPRSEYQPQPPVFPDSNWGNEGKTNVNIYGYYWYHLLYFWLFVLLAFALYSLAQAGVVRG